MYICLDLYVINFEAKSADASASESDGGGDDDEAQLMFLLSHFPCTFV